MAKSGIQCLATQDARALRAAAFITGSEGRDIELLRVGFLADPGAMGPVPPHRSQGARGPDTRLENLLPH